MDKQFVLDKDILLDGEAIAEPGIFTIQVEREVEVNVLPEEARRRVNQFVHLEISTQLRAQPPQLVLTTGQEPTWRVPVHLTLPAYGDVGYVGFVQVNPISGEVDRSPSTVAALIAHAEAVARRFTPSPANAG